MDEIDVTYYIGIPKRLLTSLERLINDPNNTPEATDKAKQFKERIICLYLRERFIGKS